MATARPTSDGELPTGLSVDEFLDWCATRPGRYELHGGTVVAMAPQWLGHIDVKSSVH